MVPLILLVVLSSTVSSISASDLPPVILVPGLGASQLEAKLSEPTSLNGWCSDIQWIAAYIHLTFYAWMNPLIMFPVLDKCSVKILELAYNNVTRKTTDLPEVITEVAGFGDPYLIEYMVNRDTLPDESQEFLKKLKNLVEETYRINGNRKIVLVTHSYGGPMTISFLRLQTQQWKDKYIKSMISLSAVLGGTMRTIQQDVTGDYLWYILFGFYDSDVSNALRTWPSIAFLMPNKKLWENNVLVKGPQKNYTISNINEFFEDLGAPNIWEMLKDQQRDVSLEPPGVEYHCLYSTTEEDRTPEMLTYDEPSSYPKYPTNVYGPGDGTVNLRSLDYCKEWTKQQTEKVQVKHFPNLNHIEILSDEGVMEYIQTILKDYAHEDIVAKR